MSAPAFSEGVQRMLTDAGWFRGRQQPTDGLEQAHRLRGLALFPLARDFACCFAGLHLFARGQVAAASLDGVLALSRVDDSRLARVEAWLGERFSVLGLLGADDKLLVMAERGALYAVGEHVLVAYGTDVTPMFERLNTLKQAELRSLN